MKRLIIILAALMAAASCASIKNMPSATCNKAELKQQYQLNKAEWDAAFAFLARTDLDTLTAGPWHQLTPSTRARVQEVGTKKGGRFELHRNVIDLFYVLQGNDKVIVSSPEDLTDLHSEYNAAKDVELWNGSKKPREVILTRHKAIILFPSDGHCPNQAVTEPEDIRIVVVKIPYVR